jgi:hypothetical protein
MAIQNLEWVPYHRKGEDSGLFFVHKKRMAWTDQFLLIPDFQIEESHEIGRIVEP